MKGRSGRSRARRIAAFAAVVAAWSFSASPATSYVFPDPTLRQVGDPVTMFDWSTQSCESIDIPDSPARAIRDGLGNVKLFASHAVTRLKIGPTLRTAQPRCEIAMSSPQNANPAMYADRQWVASPYILPDGRVFALLHNEYQGNTHSGQCPSGDYFKCWWNSISLAVSTDRGSTFQASSPTPSNLVAAVPYRYVPDAGPAGIAQPSNIVRLSSDQRYYALVAAYAYGAQKSGVCVIRTSDLSDPRAWRAWDGTGYNASFINPYTDSSDPAQHVCEPVSFPQIELMTSSLHYNTYLGKFVLVGQSSTSFATGAVDPGIYWSTSDDLIHWSTGQMLMPAEVLWSHQCGDPDPIMHPSLLDPASPSPNFETGGRQVDLFFTQFHYQYSKSTCWMSLDRDLIRVPLELDKPPDCTNVGAMPTYLASMNRDFVPVTVSGATEPDGEPMTYQITTVTQNQPVTGRGDMSAPDAMRMSANALLLRAEYGAGGGRVYRIGVRVSDSKGASCTATVKVAIPRSTADSAAAYDSFANR